MNVGGEVSANKVVGPAEAQSEILSSGIIWLVLVKLFQQAVKIKKL